MPTTLQAFISRWRGAPQSEKGNMVLFLSEFCEALQLPRPEPSGSDSDYCFEKHIRDVDALGKDAKRWMDLYKKDCFIIEAKQASEKQRGAPEIPKAGKPKAGKGGGGGRGPQVFAPSLPGLEDGGARSYQAMASYDSLLERAFGQVMGYAKAHALSTEPPPFLMVCDIGHSFHIWNRYDPRAGGGYGGFGARRIVMLDELEDPDVQSFFRTIWTNPKALDTSRQRALVTRGIALELGGLAKELLSLTTTRGKDEVAHFLMQCVFTCFAEDIGLLPGKPFTEGLRRLEQDPDEAQAFLQGWWETMDSGGKWGWQKVLRFNGGLFKKTSVPPLSQPQIALLRMAAEKDWREVEPAIFGTLLESALDDDERRRLGAHYTPRAYIQRLVDATFGHELRRQWENLEKEIAAILEKGNTPEAVEAAKAKLRAFHQHLATLQFLDPACGSGNFLYVAFDTLKRLEGEVLHRLEELGEWFSVFELSHERISPAQFKGIELNPWAAGIAELVLWIAYLQWFRHNHPAGNPPEPVLQNYGSIEQRDAVLDFDGEESTGTSRWDGKTTKLDVRGRAVPDDAARTATTRLLNPRVAMWPKADYIIGNPPFLGNANMLGSLGVGYTEALRAAYPDVPDTVDFVLYWWHRAALAVRKGEAKTFGLITTNSLRQVRQRGVLAHHLNAEKNPLKLLWAIPDHPWHDGGAAVRIAMTVGGKQGQAELWRVVKELDANVPESLAAGLELSGGEVDEIHADLSAGAKVSEAQPLKANDDLSSRGVMLFGEGFIVTPAQWHEWKQPAVVHPYRHGRDLTDRPRGVMVIDFFGLTEIQARKQFPSVYQHVLQTVKPERDQNNREIRKKNWWLFGEPNPGLHAMIHGLPRYIATVETAKHRVFQFLEGSVVPDNMIVVIASADALHLGILSSRIHVAWALAAGALLGVGNTPRYSKSRCFDPFPFPEATKAQATAIRELADELDAHRKVAQGKGVGLTQMYNLMEKLRGRETLTEADSQLNSVANGDLLLKIHQDLDAAVAQAYGWPADISEPEILERIVALNLRRHTEESKGKVRWLRPEYQDRAKTAK